MYHTIISMSISPKIGKYVRFLLHQIGNWRNLLLRNTTISMSFQKLCQAPRGAPRRGRVSAAEGRTTRAHRKQLTPSGSAAVFAIDRSSIRESRAPPSRGRAFTLDALAGLWYNRQQLRSWSFNPSAQADTTEGGRNGTPTPRTGGRTPRAERGRSPRSDRGYSSNGISGACRISQASRSCL